MRLTQYLYVHDTFPIRISAPTGLTITARICETKEGMPSAIGGLDDTLSETDPGDYGLDFSRTDLASDLASYMRRHVYLHLDDGAGWHDVWPFVVTDIDPDLLPPLPS